MKRTDAPGATENNQFTDGNIEEGTMPTVMDSSWANMIQEEICSVIEKNRIPLDSNRQDQLWAAIGIMLSNQRIQIENFLGRRLDELVRVEDLKRYATGNFRESFIDEAIPEGWEKIKYQLNGAGVTDPTGEITEYRYEGYSFLGFSYRQQYDEGERLFKPAFIPSSEIRKPEKDVTITGSFIDDENDRRSYTFRVARVDEGYLITANPGTALRLRPFQFSGTIFYFHGD